MDSETKPDDSEVSDLFESLGLGEEPGVPGSRPCGPSGPRRESSPVGVIGSINQCPLVGR